MHPLGKILQLLGVTPKITTLFYKLYNSAESCVRVNGKDTDWFPIYRGSGRDVWLTQISSIVSSII